MFDEPLSNLDAKLRVEMRAEIRRIHKRTRTTTIYVTHDQVEAMTMGDRIAVMKSGQIMQLGTPEEVYADPRNLYVAQFIGTPAINAIPAQFDGSRVTAEGTAIPTHPSDIDRLGHLAARDIVCCVRPEAIRLSDDGVPGAIEAVEPTGPDTFLTVSTEIGQFTVRTEGNFAIREDERVALDLDGRHSLFFDSRTEERI